MNVTHNMNVIQRLQSNHSGNRSNLLPDSLCKLLLCHRTAGEI